MNNTNTQPPPPSGIRETPLLARKLHPTGYVAYCTPCNWSTGICVGMSHYEGKSLAQSKLDAHRRTATHRATSTSTNGTRTKEGIQ